MCYIMSKKSVGVRELRQNLSKYLKEVKEGETFRVTERGRPVAALGPPPEEADSLEDLIATGLVRPARLDFLDLGPPPEAPSGVSLSRALEELRREEP